MKLIVEIEGSAGAGKTRLAQQIENKLRDEYSVEFVSFKRRRLPLREVYCFNIAPL